MHAQKWNLDSNVVLGDFVSAEHSMRLSATKLFSNVTSIMPVTVLKLGQALLSIEKCQPEKSERFNPSSAVAVWPEDFVHLPMEGRLVLSISTALARPDAYCHRARRLQQRSWITLQIYGRADAWLECEKGGPSASGMRS